MPWFKADDRLPDHRKVRQLGRDRLPAMGLWLLGGCWSSGALSDGFLPAEVVERWGDAKGQASGALVRVGLWRPDSVEGEDGFRFHDWPDWQPTREHVEAEREAAKLRQRERRSRDRTSTNGRSHTTRPGDVTRNGRVTTGERAADVRESHARSHADVPDPDPTRPDPTRPGVPAGTPGGERAGGPEAPAASASGGPPTPDDPGLEEHPDWPEQPCGHRHDPDRPCGRCGRARRAQQDADAEATAAQDAERAERARIAERCSCRRTGGWVEDDAGHPVVRCDHQRDRAAQLAYALDHAS